MFTAGGTLAGCLNAAAGDLTKNYAYLDWAGLRPMSAMEYEKACRGPLPVVANEYAWGSNSITSQFIGPDIDVLGPNESYSWTLNGPFVYSNVVRCGAFAKPTGSTRLNSGGSYYGVMEMSGNAYEIVVAGENYTGQTRRWKHT